MSIDKWCDCLQYSEYSDLFETHYDSLDAKEKRWVQSHSASTSRQHLNHAFNLLRCKKHSKQTKQNKQYDCGDIVVTEEKELFIHDGHRLLPLCKKIDPRGGVPSLPVFRIGYNDTKFHPHYWTRSLKSRVIWFTEDVLQGLEIFHHQPLYLRDRLSMWTFQVHDADVDINEALRRIRSGYCFFIAPKPDAPSKVISVYLSNHSYL
jgi:hypothetical protein